MRASKSRLLLLAGGLLVKPNHVYVAKPRVKFAIHDDVFHHLRPEQQMTLHLPPDSFFRSLAKDQKEYAVGLISSGIGNDGSVGLRAINRCWMRIKPFRTAESAVDGTVLTFVNCSPP